MLCSCIHVCNDAFISLNQLIRGHQVKTGSLPFNEFVVNHKLNKEKGYLEQHFCPFFCSDSHDSFNRETAWLNNKKKFNKLVLYAGNKLKVFQTNQASDDKPGLLEAKTRCVRKAVWQNLAPFDVRRSKTGFELRLNNTFEVRKALVTNQESRLKI